MGFRKYQKVEKIEPLKKDEVEAEAGKKPKLSSVKKTPLVPPHAFATIQ